MGGYTAEEIASFSAAGDWSFLEKIPLSRYSEASRLESGAPWFIGLRLEELGAPGKAREMYRAGAGAKLPKDDSPRFAEAALSRYLCLRALLRLESGTPRLTALDSLLSLLQDPKIRSLSAFSASASERSLAELETYRETLLIELGRGSEIPGGIGPWLSSRPLNADILRALGPEAALLTDGASRGEFLWRALVFARDYQRSFLDAEAALGDGPWPVSRHVLSDLGKAALYGAQDPGAQSLRFEKEAESRSGDEAYVFYYYAARLAWRSSTNANGETPAERGRRLMEAARQAAQPGEDRDAAAWYLLEAANREGLGAFRRELARQCPDWHDGSPFSGLLDDAVSRLASRRDWSALESLRRDLAPAFDRGLLAAVEARLAYISVRTGMVSPEDAPILLERVRSNGAYPSYYRILASLRLGRPFSEASDFASLLAGENPVDSSGALASLMDGLLRWGMGGRAYSLSKELSLAPAPDAAAELAPRIAAAGFPSEALRLSVFSAATVGYEPVLRDLFLSFPRPWPEDVAGASSSEGIPEYLLYALLRSESFFDPLIRSSAGAVGLSQLMENTAADTARKMGLASYNLERPGDNIAIGAAYLAELLRRLGSVSDGPGGPAALDALFAYNAGITRVREWRRTYRGLEDDLFLEAVPYAETREYGRKVLVASVLYGYLYYRTAAEVSAGSILRL